MIYRVRDSDAGDALGTLDVPDDASEEQVLELLVQAGYLQPPAEYHHLTDGDWLTDDGDRTVRDEYGEPLLVLEPDHGDKPNEHPGPEIK